MSALVEGANLESEITECCQAIYRATDPDAALEIWGRLRELISLRTERERKRDLYESVKRSLAVPPPAVNQT